MKLTAKDENKQKHYISPIYPTTITLILTFKCTAECKNCCFGCNPRMKKVMTDFEIKKYITSCMKAFPNSIKVLVITGGECMIYLQKVKYAIQIAQSYGLLTRIVTNAYWATSYKKAKDILADLKNVGLTEINFSTGDDHSEWIPLNNISYAAIASAQLGYIPIINVETHDNASPGILQFFGNNNIFMKLVKDKKIRIERGAWMRFDKETSIEHNKCMPSIRYDSCSSLFSMIPINPYGEVFACCGLPCEHIPYLRLGHFDSEPIKRKYLRSFDDLLKIWLYLDGPAKILKYIHDKQNIPFLLKSSHICDYCRTLFSCPSYIDYLKKNYQTFIGDILFKYSLYSNNLK